MEKEPYNQRDHIHCWNQKVPACGIAIESHKVCCLCEKPMENKETNEKCEHGRPTGYCSGCRIDTPVVEKSGWEDNLKEGLLNGTLAAKTGVKFNPLKDFIKNVEKEAYERGKEHGKYLETVRRMTSDAKAIADYRNIPEDKAEVVLKSARLEGKKEEEQEIKERLTKILKAATGNSGTIAVTPEVIMSNLFPEE